MTAIKSLKDIKERCVIDERGCWMWRGAKNGAGTPVANIGWVKNVTVLRYAYCLLKGVDYDSLAGKRVWSRERDSGDVNPHHAMVGTVAEHNTWRAEGGRLKGPKRVMIGVRVRDKIGRRYSSDQVEEIRASKETEVQLAERFGCSTALIGYIRRGQMYKTTAPTASVFSWRPAV